MFVVAHFHMVMGVAPIMVILGAIYHWYPKMTGRMMDERLGKIHFWITFLGAYAVFFPMHYLGVQGVPRRFYELGEISWLPPSAATLNVFITVAALTVGAAQADFLLQRLLEPAARQAVRAQSLALDDARMADGRRRLPATAISGPSCRSSIAGPTPIASRARRRISSRRTRRR